MRGDSGGSDDSGAPGVGGGKGTPRPPFQALPHTASEAEDALAPAVRLRREFKGPTAAELLQDDDLVSRLPGKVRSAMNAIARGDLPAADALLPGGFGRVLAGPGRRDRRRLRLVVTAWILLGAALLGLVALFG
jgi:hypothetical protein